MKLFICPNGYTKKQSEQARNSILTLEKSNECALSLDDSYTLFGNNILSKFKPEESDLIVSLGGDGCLLRAAQVAIKYNKPLIGINSGNLGYLCAISLSDINDFNKFLNNLVLSDRTLLEFEYDNKTFYALNDIVVAKSNFGETVHLSISVDKDIPVSLCGDGLIISTPTGSTAYNLSAGGPILDTKLPALVLTPICPHQSFMRPVVINDDQEINVQFKNNSAELYFDGNHVGKFNDEIIVKKSNHTISIYSLPFVSKGIITFS